MASVKTISFKVKKLRQDAIIPTRGSAEAAGYDLAIPKLEPDIRIGPGCRRLIKTGLSMSLFDSSEDMGTVLYGQIAPRSGLAYRRGIAVMAGIIDQDYRGEVGVILHNTDNSEIALHGGERIAQLIIKKVYVPPVEVVDELDDTSRGEGGFGSTGTQAQ